MKVKELRAFTLQYYNEHLKGKTATIKKYLKEVVFTTKAGRKLHTPMYKEKAVAVKHLQELIENSTYNNWGDRKPTDSQDVLGYLNFKSKLVIDGEKKHIRISVIVDRNRNMRFKSYDVGGKPKKKNPPMTMGVPDRQTMEGFYESKDRKKIITSKKKGENLSLGFPITEEIRKKAFTDKGKLSKGWYYDEYGLLTDGQEFYILDRDMQESIVLLSIA